MDYEAKDYARLPIEALEVIGQLTLWDLMLFHEDSDYAKRLSNRYDLVMAELHARKDKARQSK